MAFIDIPNAKKRDEIVQNYLSTITQVQQRNEDEKASNLKKQKFLEKTFEPIVRATEKSTVAITEELKKKKEEEGVDFLSHYLSLDKKFLDKYYGIQRKADGSLMMGKTKITTIGSKITIDDKTFETTPGLWSLIMLNSPQGYTNDDYAVYRDIVELTDVVNNPQNVGNGRPDTTNKYKLLEKLYWGEEQEEQEQEGEGILEDFYRKQYPGIVGYGIEFLPGDIQGLLSKLGLLLAEFKAGNYNTRNQIVAILDELKRRKQLTNKKYKEINTFLSKGAGFPVLTPGFFHQDNEDTVGATAVRQALKEISKKNI